MAEISLLDYVLLPFYVWFIYKIAYYYRDKFYPVNSPYHVYFIPALTAKVAGAIFIGLVYNYYYGGGDTFNFFYHSQIINSTFTESPATWFRLITHQADTSNMTDAMALSNMYWYDDKASYTTACIGAFIGLFCFTKYLVINVIMAAISFSGTWLMFITFAKQYPNQVKLVAIAILFIPGPIVWGSGLFKDSFCMFSVGCLIYCADIMFEKRVFKFGLLLLFTISVALLLLIKAYILVVFLPILFVRFILVYAKRVLQKFKKYTTFYLTTAVMCIIGMVTFNKLVDYASNFTIDSVLETMKSQKDYLLQISIETNGSVYDLGDFDPTLSGIFAKFWPAVNVTLFRPYVWEVNSIIQLFDALQSTIVLMLTLYLLFKRNLLSTLKSLLSDPNLIMCLLFTLFFAFLVGVTTYNFGSLSRYKIPCTPFYMLLVSLLLYKNDDDCKLFKTNEVNNELLC